MATKSKPTGIRFDLEKVAFIKQWEKLQSNQQVVDFLMNKYWWEKKVPVPTHKEVPPLHLKEEIKIMNEPIFAEPEERKTFNQYVEEKREIENNEDYEKFCRRVDNDKWLTSKQKSLIKTV